MSPRITVVGLGPAGADLLTAQARAALTSTPHRYFRTSRHPAAQALWDESIFYASYDAVYDSSDDRADVYRRIAEALVSAAADHDDVVYAVPGSPTVAEETTRLLVAAAKEGKVELVLVPGISFVEAAGAALGFDLMADGVRVVDAERAHEQITGATGPLLIGHVWRPELVSEAKVALLEHFPPDHWVALARALGGPGQRVSWSPLSELDHGAEVDPLTCIWVPAPLAPSAGAFESLVELVRRLRGPGGCPWDAEQTHHSLIRHLVEETYEVVDALESLPAEAPGGDVPAGAYDHLEEELGDLLCQVVFHAVLAAEAGAFTISDVARGIHDKLVTRHPHVFGDVEVSSSAEVRVNWERIKVEEKGRESAMDDVPASLPALLYAHKLGRRAASVGFDWAPGSPDLVAHVRSELAELEAADTPVEQEAELGDLLLMVVNWSRHLGVDPEGALRRAARRFEARFRVVEARAAERGIDLAKAGADALDELWAEAKAEVGGVSGG